MALRVLWFTNTPSLYAKLNGGYNGGGWIASLEEILGKEKDISLGIAFFHKSNKFKVSISERTYYPIPLFSSKFGYVYRQLFGQSCDQREINYFLKIIEDFKPDIIHIFGSEKSYGLLGKRIKVPIILHIQGLLGPYLNSYFPPGISFAKILMRSKPKLMVKHFMAYRNLKFCAKREQEIFQCVTAAIGRTQWDCNIFKIMSENGKYLHCDEVLRPIFYTSSKWKRYHQGQRPFKILTTISPTIYKGLDVVLKTAKILKTLNNLDFQWSIIGIKSSEFWSTHTNIQPKDAGVNFLGVLDAEGLTKEMLDSDLFVHTSYIDNSPNSICEAQLLGLPVVSTNVGGIPTLIQDGISGILVPANDIFLLASTILDLSRNSELRDQLSLGAIGKSSERHNPEHILKTLRSIYYSFNKTK